MDVSVDETAHSELSRPSKDGEEGVGMRINDKSVERDVKLDGVEGYEGSGS